MLDTNNKLIKNKIGLLNLAKELGNISKACKSIGLSEDTFCKYQEAVSDGNIESLLNKRKPKKKLDSVIEEAVIGYAIEYPLHGQLKASNELRKKGVLVSSSSIRSIWLRNSLGNTKQRLLALKTKSAEEGFIPTDSQVAALDKKKDNDIVCEKIETYYPGYLGSQDTFYVGALKGAGRVYQQTFIDTYSKVVCCKLYTTKTPIASADLLNNKALPLFEKHNIPIINILTDRGTEYCGKVDKHSYQLFLAVNEIKHTKTKAVSPQNNGICENFHKTILNEFYQVAFSKKTYSSLEELQQDLNDWLYYYNYQRGHQGEICCGRTPMDTLLDGKKEQYGKS